MCLNVVQSWEVESDRVRQKLLSLIGRIGREARSETTTGKVCWCICHSVKAGSKCKNRRVNLPYVKSHYHSEV